MCLSIAVNHPEVVLSQGEHLGFEWMTTHNTSGYRCGYIRVPKGHPWHGQDYDAFACDVHGGLTFAEPDKACEKGGKDDAWWVGFDCAHAGDLQDPDLPAKHRESEMRYRHGGTIKTQVFVEAQCRELCEQAQKASNPLEP